MIARSAMAVETWAAAQPDAHCGPAAYRFVDVPFAGGWTGRILEAYVSTDAEPRTGKTGKSGDSGSTLPVPCPGLSEWREFLDRLIRFPEDVPGRVDLKHSKVAQVFRARVESPNGALEVVCKHSPAARGWRGLVRRLRGTRERRNWEGALWLSQAGVPTARPLALLQRRRGPAEAWLVTEAIPDAMDLDSVLSWQVHRMDPRQVPRLKRALAHQAAALWQKMRDHGIVHRDFKASNVMVTDWEGGSREPRLWLVDLDGMRRRSWIFGRRNGRAQRAVTRLAASLIHIDAMTRTDAVRFLRACSSSAFRDNRWKSDWRRLARAVARYNRRAQRRKRGKLDGFLDE